MLFRSRYDQDANKPGEIDLILADIHASDTIDENALKSFMARTENASRNQQLEKQLGVNDQPVDRTFGKYCIGTKIES